MKKAILTSIKFGILVSVLLISYAIQAQNSFSIACLGKMSPEEIAELPIATIYVDFHFVRSNGLQFQCIDPNAPEDNYAPKYVQQILDTSEDYFANPEANQMSPPPVVTLLDTRIRVKLWNDPVDPCEAIFFHDAIPTSFSNPDAMHIVIFDDAGSVGVSGAQVGVQLIYLYNIHERALINGSDVNDWGSTLNHELGHRFGLCHAFSTMNTAPDMNPVAECGGPTPGVTQCKKWMAL